MEPKAQVIDITRSYIPGDPNSFPMNLVSTRPEDQFEKEPPIIIYEGYNFLPTPYGYRSYFGDNSKLNIGTLASRCDTMFIYQLGNLMNVIIALCEDGIWYTSSVTSATGTWIHAVTLTVPPVGQYKRWTFTVIDNNLYMYRQGETTYWKVTPTGYSLAGPLITLAVTPVIPTFLTMAGQIGIFKANASLGFWDSANATAWSNPLDFTDFTPSLTTLAGITTFAGLLGNIVTVKSQGDGFVIYTTKGIVGVRFISSNTLWESTVISDVAGIFSYREVCSGLTDSEHFAYTSIGIKKIGAYNALSKVHAFEDVLPEVYDILRENNDYVMLSFINGRYLFFCLMNTDYIDGRVTFTHTVVASFDLTIHLSGSYYTPGMPLPDSINGQTLQSKIAADRALGNTSDIYMRWSTTGKGSFSGYTTPMNKYVINSSGTYIPNISNKTTATITPTGDAASANVMQYVRECTPTFPDDVNNLQYIGYGSMAAAASHLGTLDAPLTSYINAQFLEWTNFITIQAANIAALNTIPASAPTVTDSTEIIYSVESPGAISPAAITAKAVAFKNSVSEASIVGNTVYYTKQLYGEFITGEGSNVGPTIIGAGTNYAECRLRRNFVGGARVRQRASRLYEGYFYSETVYPAIQVIGNPGSSYDIFIVEADPIEILAANLGTYPAVLYTAAYNAALSFMVDVTPNYPSGFTPAGSPYFSYNYLGSHVTNYIVDGLIGGSTPGVHIIAQCNEISPPYIGYGNYATIKNNFAAKYTETLSITVELDPIITDSKEMVANQNNVDWGLSTIYPPGNFSSSNSFLNGVDADYQDGVDFHITYPGSTFLMQDGSVEPIYPTYVGALVLDTSLKKWGKMKATYKTILDYNSFNSTNQNVTSFSNLGVDMATLKTDGYIYNMDSKPIDSYVKYGKIGLYRLGFTNLYEVNMEFRLPFTGSITIDSSINGSSVETSLTDIHTFAATVKAKALCDGSARWYTIKVSGNYDIQYLDFCGNMGSRR